jgi:hypothetical protein
MFTRLIELIELHSIKPTEYGMVYREKNRGNICSESIEQTEYGQFAKCTACRIWKGVCMGSLTKGLLK